MNHFLPSCFKKVMGHSLHWAFSNGTFEIWMGHSHQGTIHPNHWIINNNTQNLIIKQEKIYVNFRQQSICRLYHPFWFSQRGSPIKTISHTVEPWNVTTLIIWPPCGKNPLIVLCPIIFLCLNQIDKVTISLIGPKYHGSTVHYSEMN